MLDIIKLLRWFPHLGLTKIIEEARRCEIFEHEGALVLALHTGKPELVREVVRRLGQLNLPGVATHFDGQVLTMYRRG
jgi:hypothetical protein